MPFKLVQQVLRSQRRRRNTEEFKCKFKIRIDFLHEYMTYLTRLRYSVSTHVDRYGAADSNMTVATKDTKTESIRLRFFR